MSRTLTPAASRPVSPDEGLKQLLQLSREALNEQSWPATEGELRRLQDRVAGPRARLRWVAVAGLAAAVVALPSAWLTLRRPTALTFEVIHGTVAAGGEIRPADRSTAPADSGTRIHFSDGSEVVLDQDARTQVRDLAADGGRIVLSQGRARTFFVPRPHAHWQVAAGPYVVQVTGTVFDIEWSEEDQALDVWLHRGSVRVHGPLIGGGVVMTRGQHLLTRIRDNKIVLDSESAGDLGASTASAATTALLDAEAEPETGAAGEPGEAPEASAPAAGAARLDTHREPNPPEHAWARHLARGDFEAVISSATRRGMSTVLARGTRRELGALADAARYTRRGGLARLALRAERSRFPASTEGREAAYFLGNLAEDEGSPRTAVTWFARYLHENPSGTYASQALGRTMIIHAQQHDGTQARADAEEYLRRHPTGSYAEAARRILKPQ
jgi:TolA-binding protein